MQINPPSHTTTGSPQIFARRENIPPKLSGKNAHRISRAPRFCDAAHWDELAGKHLPAFNLPDWNVRCTQAQMIVWLERLDMTEKQYSQTTNTSLAGFCELNPTWPLRAWIGLILEVTEEGAQAQAGH